MSNEIIIEKRSIKSFKEPEKSERDGSSSPAINMLHIPRFQRNYDWPKEDVNYIINELKDYKKEINNAINKMRKDVDIRYNILNPYTDKFFEKRVYLGNIVLTKSDIVGEFDVVDGQQRLTTIYLLMKYFEFEFAKLLSNNANYFEDLSTEQPTKDRHMNYFSEVKSNLDELLSHNVWGERVPLIRSRNKHDETALETLSECREWEDFDHEVKMKKPSSKHKYWKYINHIKKELSDQTNDDLIKLLYGLLTIDLGVVIIRDKHRACELFEKLNSRGEKLSMSDLIKNLFYWKLEDEIEAEKIWEEIIRKIKKIHNLNPTKELAPKDITRAIQGIFSVELAKNISEKEIYKIVSSLITDKDKASDWLNKINNYLDSYIFFQEISNSEEINDESCYQIKRSINTIPTIYYPILFNLFYMSERGKNIPIEDVGKILYYLEVQSFLHLAVKKYRSNTLAPKVPIIIKQIKEMTSYEEIKKVLDRNLKPVTFVKPSETINDLLANLTTAKLDSKPSFIQLMGLMFNYNDPMFGNIEWGKVKIEKLLPKDAKRWIENDIVTKEDAQTCEYVIGNLFPVFGNISSKDKNNLYLNKLNNPKYIKDKERETSLRNYDLFAKEMHDAFVEIPKEWNKEMIDKRSKHIIKRLQKRINIWD